MSDFVRRNRITLLVATALVVVLAVTTIIWLRATADDDGPAHLRATFGVPDYAPGNQNQMVLATATVGGRPVALAARGSRVALWDLTADAPDARIDHPVLDSQSTVAALAVAELDGHPVAVVGADHGVIQVWNLDDGRRIGADITGYNASILSRRNIATTVLDGRSVIVTGVDIAPTGQQRNVGTGIGVFDLATGAPLDSPLPAATAETWPRRLALASLDGRTVVAASDGDGVVRTWDLATGQPAGPAIETGRAISAFAATTLDGRGVIVTGDGDGSLSAWDLATGEVVGAPMHHPTVQALDAANIDGRAVAISGGWDGLVRIWDLGTGEPIGPPLGGDEIGIYDITTTVVDGRPVILSTGTDLTVRVWDYPG